MEELENAEVVPQYDYGKYRKPEPTVKTIAELLQTQELTIPHYQRSYKWTKKNVNQLLEDLYAFRDRKVYRLGTIITHIDNGSLNIVDGQQRIVTFLLIYLAINDTKKHDIKDNNLIKLLEDLSQNAFFPSFKNDISKVNIQTNYMEIKRQIAGFEEETIDFIFNRCEVIQLVLGDISEAFQFFDSQNARGKDLEPHDLLKAYHLREFANQDQKYKKEVVGTWESMKTKELSMLFANYLYRIKGWLKGESARHFTKNDIELFKGINPDNGANYPHARLLSIIHYYVDGFNSSYERNIDQSKLPFPFQLEQPQINGRRFFEMVNHYHHKVFKELNPDKFRKNLTSTAAEVMDTLESYNGRKRTGDAYARMLFDCALIYYVDKFGYSEISRAVEKLFIWSYSLRLRFQLLSLASVDNYVKDETNIFKVIKDAIEPKDVLSVDLDVLYQPEIKSTKSDELLVQFEKLSYYAEN